MKPVSLFIFYIGKMQENGNISNQSIEIKPNFWSYILFGYSGGSILVLFIILIISIFILGIGVIFSDKIDKFSPIMGIIGISIPAIVISFSLLIVMFIDSLIRYKKEKYILEGNKIIYKYGSLFTENSVEVKINRFIQVSSKLPFLENLIMKTGSIFIKTAGGSGEAIYMKNLNSTSEIYARILDLMQKNGFRMQMNELVQEEKPHPIAILGEMFGRIIPTLIIFAVIFLTDRDYQNLGNEALELSKDVNAGLFFIIGAIVFAIISFFIICHYLDLKKRKYKLFTDSVTYSEGFLTKHFSVIPIENISDINNSQSFWSRILGIHDLVISSPGIGNEITFKNMMNGVKFSENLKYIKNQITQDSKTSQKVEVSENSENSNENNSPINFSDKTEKPLNYNKEFTLEFKMSLRKLAISLVFYAIALFGIIGIIFILVKKGNLDSEEFSGDFVSDILIGSIGSFAIILPIIIKSLIAFFATTYKIGESTLEKTYSFLNTSHTSFAVEKVTGIVVTRGILDRIVGTCSIKIYSVGSTGSLNFSNINFSEELEKNIINKVGIHLDQETKEIETNFNFLDYAKSKIGNVLALAVLMIIILSGIILINKFGGDDESLKDFTILLTFLPILIIIFPLLRYFYAKIFYAKSRYNHKIYSEAIVSKRGFFILNRSYTLVRHVKFLSAKKYPFTKTGNFTLDMAGEIAIQDPNAKNSAGAFVLDSLRIKIPFTKEAFNTLDEVDNIVNEAPIERENVFNSRQSILNILPGYLIGFGIVIAGIWFGLGFGMQELSPESTAFTEDLKILSNLRITAIGFVIGIFIITFGIQIYSILVVRYEIEKARILKYHGIIYRNKTSILYSNLNYIEKKRRFLNMIFGNGTIYIYTLGSSKVDLALVDTDGYEVIYKNLEK